MNSIAKPFALLCISLLFITQNSCVSFKPGWKDLKLSTKSTNIDDLIVKAKKLETIADSKEELLKLLDIYKEIESADPENYYALWKTGNYNILLGAAYSPKKKDKKYYYKQAIQYCEKAMSTNEDFLNRVNNGEEIVEASKSLTLAEIDAMGYWYTARFYYFKDCLSPLGRVMNTRIVIDNNSMIDLIDKLDPSWAGGGNYFSRALYYIAVPEKFGGSKKRAADEFDLAIKTGPNYIVNKWGRAKYLYFLVGDTTAMKKDLQWVIDQNPHSAGNTYPWNVYFQNDAKKMLAEN
ncbi:MAG: hypothetical protein C0595_02625 [Marinilabiliales bacterium]|nr:MAG: hypothetical protein C0595_02625 [Marinilabiliales bacterium]